MKRLTLASAAAALCATSLATAGGALTAAPSSSGWTVTSLERGSNPDGVWATGATAIDEAGRAIGNGAARDGEHSAGFVWENGRLTALRSTGAAAADTYAAAVDDRGRTVGWASTAQGVQRATLWEGGRARNLGTLPGRRWSTAVAVGPAGEVIGYAYTLVKSPRFMETEQRAFIWRSGRLRALGTLGGPVSVASALSSRGDVVGWSATKRGARHAFLWRDGRMRDLGTLPGKTHSIAVAVNTRGQVVGYSYSAADASDARAFVWQAGKLTDLGTPAGRPARPVAINDSGRIIGQSYTRGHSRYPTYPQAFVWEHGTLAELARPGWAAACEAAALNQRGQVVGSCSLETGRADAYLWENGKGIDLLYPGGDKYARAIALNERDQIVGVHTGLMEAQYALLWQK